RRHQAGVRAQEGVLGGRTPTQTKRTAHADTLERIGRRRGTIKSLRRNDERIVLPTHVNGGEIADRRVGTLEVPCREHRGERDYPGARASGSGNTRRRIFEHDTCCGVESEAFRSESITIGRRLSL